MRLQNEWGDRNADSRALVGGQWIGYVHVSTPDQNEKRQLDGQVLDRVFTDKASGRDTRTDLN